MKTQVCVCISLFMLLPGALCLGGGGPIPSCGSASSDTWVEFGLLKPNRDYTFDEGDSEEIGMPAVGAAGEMIPVPVTYAAALAREIDDEPDGLNIEGFSFAIVFDPDEFSVVGLDSDGIGQEGESYEIASVVPPPAPPVEPAFFYANADNDAGEMVIGIVAGKPSYVGVGEIPVVERGYVSDGDGRKLEVVPGPLGIVSYKTEDGEIIPAADVPLPIRPSVRSHRRYHNVVCWINLLADASLSNGTYTIEFLNGITGAGDVPIDNLVTCQGSPCRPDIVNGSIEIVQDPPIEYHRPFIRGDANWSGGVEIGDGTTILGVLFPVMDLETDRPFHGTQWDRNRYMLCPDAFDFDDDGSVTIGDAIGVLQYLFARGDPPKPPFLDCGPDLTEDDLHCSRGTCP